MLGTVELDTAAGVPSLHRWPRIRRLFAVLLVHAGEVVSVDRLGDVLWGRDLPAHPTSAVHNLVSRLRFAVRSAGLAETVRIRAPGYLLEVDPGAVDAARFERLVPAARARTHAVPAAAADLVDRALALWHGPAFGVRRRGVRRYRGGSAGGAQAAGHPRSDRGRPVPRAVPEAIRRLEPVLAADPLPERPRHQLMRALHGAGRSTEALLRGDLRLDPSPQLRGLEVAIIRHELAAGGASAESAPLHNLPPERAELVGRSEDVARVSEAMRSSRLVTLTGVGGVGKTRLARHVANQVVSEHRDGGWLCGLAPVGPDAVDEVVTAAVGVRRRPGTGLAACLADDLRGDACCSSSTTVITSRPASPLWSTPCCAAVQACGCWPPAGSTSTSRASGCGPSLRRRPRARGRARRRRARRLGCPVRPAGRCRLAPVHPDRGQRRGRGRDLTAARRAAAGPGRSSTISQRPGSVDTPSCTTGSSPTRRPGSPRWPAAPAGRPSRWPRPIRISGSNGFNLDAAFVERATRNAATAGVDDRELRRGQCRRSEAGRRVLRRSWCSRPCMTSPARSRRGRRLERCSPMAAA